MNVQPERVRALSEKSIPGNVLVYWMSREQRVQNNWALLYAQQLAIETNSTLCVVFTLTDNFPGATLRAYDFMLKGLREVEKSLQALNIPFIMLKGQPNEVLIQFCAEFHVHSIVSDFDPLRAKKQWKQKLVSAFQGTIYEVDAHNVVPCWLASDKEEYGAYTLRPKLRRLLNKYLVPYPKQEPQTISHPLAFTNNWDKLMAQLVIDRSVQPVKWILPGEKQALLMQKEFFQSRILQYNNLRNNPLANVQSDLSPYLHFGQISSQAVLVELMKEGLSAELTDPFVEQLLVRKELSDNYCYYNSEYDNYEGFRSWAKQSLDEHLYDEREYTYTQAQFESSATHDALWNACQANLVSKGKMHGYLRMYWAKKILEWSSTPQVAMQTAVYLNDKYELDGRDPNGYVGCAWSIGGVHDRPWFERPVFGKIRYMSQSGAQRKFDVYGYISAVNQSTLLK